MSITWVLNVYRKTDEFLIACLVISLLLAGCATVDQSMQVGRLENIEVVKFARLETPPLLKITVGAQAVAAVGVMFGAIGGGLGGAASHQMMVESGKEVQSRCGLPDFGELVAAKLLDRLPAAFPEWPSLAPEPSPVDGDFKSDTDYVLLVCINSLKLQNGEGLLAIVTAQMRDPADTIFWQKRFSYKSTDFNLPAAVKDLEAEDGELLRAEFDFAADQAVSAFINHLKGAPQLTPEDATPTQSS